MSRTSVKLFDNASISDGQLSPRTNRGSTGQVESIRRGDGRTLEIEYLIISGGNGGIVGSGNYGGDAGGYRTNVPGSTNGYNAALEKILVIKPGQHLVIVGAGGGTNGGKGNPSQFSTIMALPNAGSTGLGAGGPGSGGPGLSNSITGTAVMRGGGGSPAGDYSNGNGGIDGGGGGGIYFNDYYGYAYKKGPGEPNTGGGGGGYYPGGTGFAGGSGLVVIRYLTNKAAANNFRIVGGTVTSYLGYTIHSFTSTGYMKVIVS